MPTYICKNCSEPFQGRLADRRRGWAKFCSKSCKASKQEARTGQYKRYKNKETTNAENDPYVYVEGGQKDYYAEYLDSIHPFSEEAVSDS